MIACVPKIVVNPAPAAGSLGNSAVGASSPTKSFSSALQEATQSLRQPSVRSKVVDDNPGHENQTVPHGSKIAAPLADTPSQSTVPQPAPDSTHQASSDANAIAALVLPVIPALTAIASTQSPVAATTQAGNTEAAEPRPTAAQLPFPLALPNAHFTSPVDGSPQQLILGLPSNLVMSSGSADKQNGLDVATVIAKASPALPTAPTGLPEGTPAGSKQIASTPATQQAGKDLPLPPPGVQKQEAASPRAELPHASNSASAQTNQVTPAASLPKQSMHAASAFEPAASATQANNVRPVPQDFELNRASGGGDHQTTSVVGPSTSAVVNVPQIEIGLPNISSAKLASSPAAPLHAASGPAANLPVEAAQPSAELSSKNGDTGKGGTTQSGASKSGASSFPRADDQTTEPAEATPSKQNNGGNAAAVGLLTAQPAASHSDAAAGAPRSAAQPHSFAASIAEADARAEAMAADPSSLLHSAKLIERLGQSELRVGIQAGEFGSVDIRTSMVRNQFTAQISVERSELGRALAAELPSLQHRLAEQRVPTASILLENQSNGSSAGFGQGWRHNQPLQPMTFSRGSEADPGVTTVFSEGSTSAARLDVHM